jgi:16S rRNA (guanine966-N2)-methyltransferase
MRITGGYLKGRKINSPRGVIEGFRPTTDFLRESIFSSLGTKINFEGLRILDLYAGTGILGIEALSRGAQSVVFVEKNKECCEVIRSNLMLFGLGNDQNFILKTSFSKMTVNKAKFDLVLADPPYETVDLLDFIKELQKKNILLQDTLLVFEDRASIIKKIAEKFKDEDISGVNISKFKCYGESGYVILSNNNITLST